MAETKRTVLPELIGGFVAAMIFLALLTLFLPEERGGAKPGNSLPPPQPDPVPVRPMTPELRRIIDKFKIEANKAKWGGDLDGGLNNGEMALKYLRETGQVLESAQYMITLAEWWAEKGDINRAAKYYLVAYQEGRDNEGDDWKALASKAYLAHRDFSFALSDKGRHDQALASLEVFLREFRKRGDEELIGHALHNQAWVICDAKGYDRAIEVYERALAIRRKLGDKENEGWTLNNMGYTHMKAGRFSKAVDRLLQATALSEDRYPGLWKKAVDNLVLTAEKAASKGAFDAALRGLGGIEKSIREKGEGYLLERVLFQKATVLRQAREFEASVAVLEELVEIERAQDYRYGMAAFRLEIAKTRAAAGDMDDAVRIFDRVIAALGELSDLIGQGWALDAKARALNAAGREREAEDTFQEALTAFEMAGRNREGILQAYDGLLSLYEKQDRNDDLEKTRKERDSVEMLLPRDDLKTIMYMEGLESRAPTVDHMPEEAELVAVRRAENGWDFLDRATGRETFIPFGWRGRHVVFQGLDFRVEGGLLSHEGLQVFLAVGETAVRLKRGGLYRRSK